MKTGLNNVLFNTEQYCLQHCTMWAAKHASLLLNCCDFFRYVIKKNKTKVFLKAFFNSALSLASSLASYVVEKSLSGRFPPLNATEPRRTLLE